MTMIIALTTFSGQKSDAAEDDSGYDWADMHFLSVAAFADRARLIENENRCHSIGPVRLHKYREFCFVCAAATKSIEALP